MRFNIRDLAVGTFVILFAGVLIFLINRGRGNTLENQITPVATSSPSLEEKVKGAFNVNIPDDIDKVELSDVSGEGQNYFGVTTRSYKNNVFELTILADLPENNKYIAKIAKDDGTEIDLGQMVVAKGGFMINFTKNTDLTDYKKVTVLRDNKILLSGRFL
ncbi:hypothetical protein HYS03_00120 [Candidatus Woesebacteria bacterium]|nr:hypothetical protein [Candidatus Woesebacteria bacterium]QQG47600.1 MAG: hypothetical protein HY044_00725 [Candidatus Woesebacteria bacterium]